MFQILKQTYIKRFIQCDTMSTKFIERDMPIKEILKTSPKAAEILVEYGLMCVGCPYAGEHSLKEIKDIYGFTEKDIEEILARLNKIEKKENKNDNKQ